LPVLEHHTYREDDVEEGGIKIKKTNFFLMKMAIFLGRVTTIKLTPAVKMTQPLK
jgi:hypothetical protein